MNPAKITQYSALPPQPADAALGLAGRHMHGTKPGGQNILALRCIHRGNPREEFWKHRRNTRAALNDPLPLPA
jgi:hypothetical protein